MIKQFGDLHKLRLLNFDSGDAKETKVFEGEISKPCQTCTSNFNKNIKCSTNGYVGKCSNFVKTKSSSETSFKETRSRKLGTRINSIFKKQSNQSKLPITKGSVSLYNLKQTFSSTSFLVKNPIKKTLKKITEKSLRRKQDKHDHYKKTDVRVLFMSERQKDDRKFKKPNISEDTRKLDWINNSRSSYVFNFNSNQQHSDKKYLTDKNNNRLFRNCNHNNHSICEFKQYKEHNTDPVRIKHCVNLNSKAYENIMPMHYKLVDFSCSACKIESRYNGCVHKISPIDTCPCVNKQVWVTTPCLDSYKNGSGVSGNFSDNFLTPNLKINNAETTTNVNKIKKRENGQSCLYKLQIRLPSFSPNLTNNPKSLAKLTLKYIPFVIVVIVWSPCILLLCIYWVITYPVRPLNILEKINLLKGNMCGFKVDCGRNCCQSILNSFALISAKVNYSYNMLYTLIKKQKNEESQYLKPCSFRSLTNKNCLTKEGQKLCPNPKNKYTLHYTRHRGWIMKPLKKRQSINKRCECNIQEFANRRENIHKKVMRDQECECFPQKLKDKTKSKTIKSLSRYPPKKVISQKTLPVSNICDRLPKICCKDAFTIPPSSIYTGTKASPDLITNKSCDHKAFRHQSLGRYPENSDNRLRIKTQRNVFLEGNLPESLDLSDPRNAQIMSPRLNVQSPFYLNTSHKECFPQHSLDNIIKGRSPCTCQRIRRVPTLIRYKRPKQYKQKPICPKNARTKICERPSRLDIKPKFLCRKYEGKGKRLTKKQKVYCWCKSARKNVGEVIHDVECEVWKCNYCKDSYIHTLRRKPWFWVYQRCPSFYPYFFIFYKFYENVVIALLFIISTCIWVPILCWCYFCFSLFCRCCRC